MPVNQSWTRVCFSSMTAWLEVKILKSCVHGSRRGRKAAPGEHRNIPPRLHVDIAHTSISHILYFFSPSVTSTHHPFPHLLIISSSSSSFNFFFFSFEAKYIIYFHYSVVCHQTGFFVFLCFETCPVSFIIKIGLHLSKCLFIYFDTFGILQYF